jgi:hypothetical protein
MAWMPAKFGAAPGSREVVCLEQVSVEHRHWHLGDLRHDVHGLGAVCQRHLERLGDVANIGLHQIGILIDKILSTRFDDMHDVG